MKWIVSELNVDWFLVIRALRVCDDSYCFSLSNLTSLLKAGSDGVVIEDLFT